MNRRSDLDVLRIVLCASVILQHAILIYAAEPRYHVKAATVSAGATAVYEVLRIFAMPPFFAIAGWAAVASLRRRSAAQFLRERAVRLGIPLLVGIFLFGPAIKYLELREGRDMGLAGFRLVEPIQTGFLDFLPRYYTRSVLVTWSHLWFVAYLLLYSIGLLPLLRRIAARPMSQCVPSPAWVYLPAAPLAAVLALFHGYWPYLPNLVDDWTNFAYFALCFLAGGIIAAWPGCESRLRAQAPGLILLALIGYAGVLTFGESTIGRLAVGLAAWGCIGGAWALAGMWEPRPSPWLTRAAEATLPVYVVHHLPLLWIAVWMTGTGLPVAVQVALIAGIDTLLAVALYVWLIRPWAVPRVLFGLPPRRA
ncbi:MAG: acyltransferase family protein [Acetobacteraceae bacterium]